MKLLPLDYATRNLGRSLPRLFLGVFGSALVVLLVIAAAGFVRGMRASLAAPEGDRNVILLGAGSEESIERSEVDQRAAEVAASLRGVRERLGERYVSPEVHIALSIRTDLESKEGRLTPVRGVRPVAYLVHPQVQIVAGRAPEPGQDEVMVGGLVGRQLGVEDERLAPGEVLTIDNRPWTISGRFRAPRTTMDGEIWMPLGDLQVVGQRDDLSCVVLTLDATGDLADVQTLAAQRLDLELTAMSESDYYSALARFYAPIRAMVLITAALIALGGILGGLNTMLAAFAARVREVGTLQVLGYSRRAIVLSFVQESLIVASSGALIAGFLGKALLDGLAVRFSMGAFGLVVDAPVLLVGVGAGITLGVIGALPPALRCMRLPVGQALRA
jgi:putative ABC transport system permease protein